MRSMLGNLNTWGRCGVGGIMRIAALGALLALLPGCGSLLLYDDLSGYALGIHGGSVEQVVETSGHETRRRIDVEAWPLVVRCVDEERVGRERVQEIRFGYDVGMRLAIGLIALGEGLLAGGMWYGGSTDGWAEWGYAIPAALLSIDAALALGFALFAPANVQLGDFEREGAWRTVSTACPSPLELEVSGIAVAVVDGAIAEEDQKRLLTELIASGELRITHGGEAHSLALDPATRCALAREHRIEVPACAAAPVLPLEAPAPVRIEIELDLQHR